MGFFDDLELPGRDHGDDDYSPPEWWAAPENVLAGVVPLEMTLAENTDAAVVISRVAAYPQGFQFDAELLTRKPMHHDSFDLIYDHSRPEGEIPPELVRLGIQFSDGRSASSFGQFVPGAGTSLVAIGASDEEKPPDPERDIFMNPGGGGGGTRHQTQTYWVWPLCPAGTLRFVCEWPTFQIPETVAEVDAGLLREASQHARRLWH